MLCGWAVARATSAADVERFEYTRTEMGAQFKLVFYAADKSTANRAAEAAYRRVEQLNSILSDYDPQSELSRLSQAGPTPEPVPLSEGLWAVLSRSQQLAQRCEGAFDVTVGPFVRLWRRARRSKEMPSPERLAAARDAVGYKYLVLDAQQHTARLLRPQMQLDLGGIAMGYAVDETLALLRSHGIRQALVDGSGDIGVGDPPPGKEGWTIRLDPQADPALPGRFVLLANRAVTTSGDAFQHVEIDGRRYSHIVDPHTGLGLTDRTAVTVIADDCITADSLATAVSVLGPQAGLKLVAETPGASALVVRAGTIRPEEFTSPGFANFLTEP